MRRRFADRRNHSDRGLREGYKIPDVTGAVRTHFKHQNFRIRGAAKCDAEKNPHECDGPSENVFPVMPSAEDRERHADFGVVIFFAPPHAPSSSEYRENGFFGRCFSYGAGYPNDPGPVPPEGHTRKKRKDFLQEVFHGAKERRTAVWD